ncbi:MAG: RT0821/Lpp0805 family surface protein [Alphaproteobacteria bacterium]
MRKIAIVSLTAMTAACANVDTGYGVTTYEAMGIVAGGLAGGAVGAELGAGVGQMISMAGGTLAGAGFGYVAGGILGESDQAAYDKSSQMALNSASDGSVSEWSNPETGNGGILIPTRTYMTGDGRYCRDYRVTHAVKDEAADTGAFIRKNGSACQQADGSWKKLEQDLG